MLGDVTAKDTQSILPRLRVRSGQKMESERGKQVKHVFYLFVFDIGP